MALAGMETNTERTNKAHVPSVLSLSKAITAAIYKTFVDFVELLIRNPFSALNG